MWLVERVRDDGYEGEVRKALFVTTDQTMAQDFCVAAVIEAEAGATIPSPLYLRHFDGLPKAGGIFDAKADYEEKMATWREKLRTIVTLDKMDDDALSFLSSYSYECSEVEVR